MDTKKMAKITLSIDLDNTLIDKASSSDGKIGSHGNRQHRQSEGHGAHLLCASSTSSLSSTPEPRYLQGRLLPACAFCTLPSDQPSSPSHAARKSRDVCHPYAKITSELERLAEARHVRVLRVLAPCER